MVYRANFIEPTPCSWPRLDRHYSLYYSLCAQENPLRRIQTQNLQTKTHYGSSNQKSYIANHDPVFLKSLKSKHQMFWSSKPMNNLDTR